MFAVREWTDHHCTSVAAVVVCVSTIVRLPRRSVSRNVSHKLPFIAVLGDHHCKPLHVIMTAVDRETVGRFDGECGHDDLQKCENPAC